MCLSALGEEVRLNHTESIISIHNNPISKYDLPNFHLAPSNIIEDEVGKKNSEAHRKLSVLKGKIYSDFVPSSPVEVVNGANSWVTCGLFVQNFLKFGKRVKQI